MKRGFRRRKRPPFKVRLWDLLPLETQLLLIQLDLVDPALVLVDAEAPKLAHLLLMESRDRLERIMREKPRYCIFQPTLRGLRSPKVSFQDPVGKNDRADNRKC